MALLSSVVNGGYGARSGWGGQTPEARATGQDWFATQGAPPSDTGAIPALTVPLPPGSGPGPGAGQIAGGDTSWWNPQDPRGSIDRLFAGQPPSSQTILAHAPQLQAVGIQISPPNAEGVTSKINIPGVGWTRILEGGVAGGQGTGWNYVPQGTTGPGGSIPMDGSAPGGVAGGGGPGGRYDPDFDYRMGTGGQWQQDPGYQFRIQEGQKAIERSAAARGTLLTGGTLKGLERYSQGVASDEYQRGYARRLGEQQNRYQQLYGLSSLGQNAAAQQGNANSGYANQGGDIMTQIGNAQAGGTIGGSNAWQNVINQGTNAAQQWYLTKLFQSGWNPGGPTGASADPQGSANRG